MALVADTFAAEVIDFGFVASSASRLGLESVGIGGGVAVSISGLLDIDDGSSLFILNDKADLLAKSGGSFRGDGVSYEVN